MSFHIGDYEVIPVCGASRTDKLYGCSNQPQFLVVQIIENHVNRLDGRGNSAMQFVGDVWEIGDAHFGRLGDTSAGACEKQNGH